MYVYDNIMLINTEVKQLINIIMDHLPSSEFYYQNYLLAFCN